MLKPTEGSTLALVATVFRDECDMADVAYFNHCYIVAQGVKYLNDDDVYFAALLHDLVEDTAYSLLDLKNLGYSDRCISMVAFLTHNKKTTSYGDYIVALSASMYVSAIKLSDLSTNSDPDRFLGYTSKDFARLRKYLLSTKFLRMQEYDSDGTVIMNASLNADYLYQLEHDTPEMLISGSPKSTIVRPRKPAWKTVDKASSLDGRGMCKHWDSGFCYHPQSTGACPGVPQCTIL